MAGEAVVRSPDPVDRAAFALGVASLASAVAGLVRGTFGFVHLGPGGFVVAVVLGAIAAAGGWCGRRALAAAAGMAYLLAAVAQAALIGRNGDVLRGDGSTVSFWLGLGVGLLTVGLAARIWPDEPAGKGNR
jgi:hypothetical protein